MHKNKKRKTNKKLFKSPSALNLVREDGLSIIHCFIFNETQCIEFETKNWAEVEEALKSNSDAHVWLNIYPLENRKLIEDLMEYYKINPFLMADAVDSIFRPKTWLSDSHLFSSFKMLKDDNNVSENISIILGDGHLISFQNDKQDVFEHIRERLRNNQGTIRKMSSDYHYFLLCDAIIDQYIYVSDKLEDDMEIFEQQIYENINKASFLSILETKKKVSEIRKDMFATNEVLLAVNSNDCPLISDFVKKLFQSISHNSRYTLDVLSRQVDNTVNLSDLYFSYQNSRLNETMKWLTIMSSIFIPLGFLAGIYGMNFNNMPELDYRYAYPILLGIMLCLALTMIWIFKKRRWI